MPYIESNSRSPAWKQLYLNKETKKAECQVADCGKILEAKNGSTRRNSIKIKRQKRPNVK